MWLMERYCEMVNFKIFGSNLRRGTREARGQGAVGGAVDAATGSPVAEAVDMIHLANEQGYETLANLMAVSNITESEIDTVREAIAPTAASTMVIVDSFGHLYREQVDRL